MDVEIELRNETEKWLKKIKAERKCIVLNNEKNKDFIKNIDAYISDSEFFLKKGKLIEAFEAVIWSWAYMQIGQDFGILSNQKGNIVLTK